MRAGLLILGVLGLAAVAWRFLRAALRFLKRGADTLIVGEVADNKAQRGDITGMQEAAVARMQSGRTRRRAAAFALLWLVLLIVPVLTSATTLLYALYSPLWLLRTHRSPQRF